MEESDKASLKRKIPSEWLELTVEEIDSIKQQREKEIAELQRLIELKRSESRKMIPPESPERQEMSDRSRQGQLPLNALLLQYFLAKPNSTGTVSGSPVNTSVTATTEPDPDAPALSTSFRRMDSGTLLAMKVKTEPPRPNSSPSQDIDSGNLVNTSVPIEMESPQVVLSSPSESSYPSVSSSSSQNYKTENSKQDSPLTQPSSSTTKTSITKNGQMLAESDINKNFRPIPVLGSSAASNKYIHSAPLPFPSTSTVQSKPTDILNASSSGSRQLIDTGGPSSAVNTDEQFVLTIPSRDPKNTKPHVLKLIGKTSFEVLRDYVARTMSATLPCIDDKKTILEGRITTSSWACTLLLNVNKRYKIGFSADLKEKLANFPEKSDNRNVFADVFIVGTGEGLTKWMARNVAALKAVNVFIPSILFDSAQIAIGIKETEKHTQKLAILFNVSIDDPSVTELCLQNELHDLLPFPLLWLTCMRSKELNTELPRVTRNAINEDNVTVTVGSYSHSVEVGGKMGKQRAAQGLLNWLHSDVKSYWEVITKYLTFDPDTGKPIPRPLTDVSR